MCPFKLPHPTPSKVKSLLDLLFVILCHFLLRYNSYTVKFNLFEFFSLVIFSVFVRLHLSSLSNSRTSSPLKGTLYSLSVTAPILPFLQPLAITNLHSVFGLCIFWTLDVSGTLYVAPCVWLLSFIIMFSRVIHVVVRINISFCVFA